MPNLENSTPTIVVLISGRGSNLQALVQHAQQTGEFAVSAVISNKSNAGGLEFARISGLATVVVDQALFPDRDAYDEALASEILKFQPDLIVLAGFMRILTPGFVSRFENRIVNVHPSLLPAFTGLNTHQRALDAGVRVHGATVHLVTAELDLGPIIDQAVLSVNKRDNSDRLAARVLALEHQMYPRAVSAYLRGQVVLQSGQIKGAKSLSLINGLSD